MTCCSEREDDSPCYECLLESVQRVRELHKPIKNNEVLAWWYDKYKPEDLFCVECMQNSDTEYSTDYPCPTIKALDGEQ